MNVLFTILTVLVLVASVLITLIVLLQNGKGVRQTADILEKITWGLVGFIFVVSIVTAFTHNNHTAEIDYTERIEVEAPAPEFPAAIPSAENPADLAE